jgi:hypothetical protein
MSSRKRISLRTPQPHGAYSSLLRGLVYEHLDPSERNHVTDSQFLRQTRHQSHNGSKSHITRTLSHTSHIRSPKIYPAATGAPTTPLFFHSGQRSKCSCSRKSAAKDRFLLSRSQERHVFWFFCGTGGREQADIACMQGWTDIYTQQPQAQTQKLPCFKPAFSFLQCDFMLRILSRDVDILGIMSRWIWSRGDGTT